MTDSELLDGLERIFATKAAVVRTCRSGVKVEIADGDFRYADEGGTLRDAYFGPDVRTAVRHALTGGRGDR